MSKNKEKPAAPAVRQDVVSLAVVFQHFGEIICNYVHTADTLHTL